MLKAFKNQPTHSGLVEPRASHLICWTERGAARHAKLLETDQAWEVFERLEDAYFNPPLPVVTADTKRVRSVFGDYVALAKLADLDKNQAAIAANRPTLKQTGVDVLGELGLTHMLAPKQVVALTPTEIGKELGGLTARAVNARLQLLGYQTAGAADSGPPWLPIGRGVPLSRWFDARKQHGDGAVQQLKWSAAIVDELRATIGQVAADEIAAG